MSDEPAATGPAKEPEKAATTPAPKPPTTPNFRTHCPRCHAPALIHATEHCPNKPTCHWRICQCGTTWDRTNGRNYPAQQG